MKRTKTIIGIHGLGNKPPHDLLEEWWRLSLQEGLDKINSKSKLNEFNLVYWADVLHDVPLNIHATEDEDETYLDERYFPSDEEDETEEPTFSESLIQSIKEQLNNLVFNEKLHVNYPAVTDFVIKHFFNDLSIYFDDKCEDENNKDCVARDSIRNRLKQELVKHKNDEIFLIAHSMGSIIAYDVLMQLGNSIKINTLVTIGSPLGVPFIYNKIKEETSQTHLDKMRVPVCITGGWYNFADPKDKLAVNYKLEELFVPNKNGVSAKSSLVKNDYKSKEGANPHKSFGYLRTRQVAALVEGFITAKSNKLGGWITEKFSGFMAKVKGRFK